MSSWDTTLSLAVPFGRLAVDTSLSSFTGLFDDCREHAVYTISRNDALHRKLASLCAVSTHGLDLYLLRDFVVLSGAEIVRAVAQIRNLLCDIETNPQVVRLATRFQHLPSSEATSTTEGWVRYYFIDAAIRDWLK